MSEFNIADLTSEQLKMLLREAQSAEKAVEQATAQRIAETGITLLTTVVTDGPLTYSASSGWVGRSVKGLPFTVDGVEYAASVTVTHTAETARRAPLFLAIKKAGTALKLSGDDLKEYIASELAATVPVQV